jgi:hypothetical protein
MNFEHMLGVCALCLCGLAGAVLLALPFELMMCDVIK